jgi:hypothetical protein
MPEEPPPGLRDIWLGLVLAGARSKFQVTTYAVFLLVAVWLFVDDRPGNALFVLAVTVLTFAKVPLLAGLAIGLGIDRLRSSRENRT